MRSDVFVFFCFCFLFSNGSLLLFGKKILPRHNVQPKLRFRQTWADFSRTLSDDQQLFAALLQCSRHRHIREPNPLHIYPHLTDKDKNVTAVQILI